MFGFDSGVLVPIFAMAIPVVAIAGGITAGIVRMILKARVMELAQRERIAAIERGVDPAKLTPVPGNLDDDSPAIFTTPRQMTIHRARGLLVGGIITLGVGVGLSAMLALLVGEDERVWAVGLIPAFIGLALLISAALMRRAADEDDRVQSPGPRA